MRVLITCGPTWVAIDDVRVISNVSTGQMGHLIAQEFRNKGAQVTLIEGQVTNALKTQGIKVIKYAFFDELAKILKTECAKKYDVVVHAAAVSDFKPARASKTKLSSDRALTLNLVPAEKLINQIKRISPNSFLVGFKLASRFNPKNIGTLTSKLFTESRCDLVIANSINPKYNAYIIDADKNILIKTNSKKKVARLISGHSLIPSHRP